MPPMAASLSSVSGKYALVISSSLLTSRHLRPTVSDHDGPCALFDALYVLLLPVNRPSCILTFRYRIEPALFRYDKDATPWGAYNKLCNPPAWPFTGSSKRDGVSRQPVRHDEKVIGPSVTVVTADNCTETHVTPSASWVNYAPNKDFVTSHGHYTVSLTPVTPN